MKTSTLFLICSLAIPMAIAETDTPANPPPPPPPAREGMHRGGLGKERRDGPGKRFLERLSPEIRERFEAARAKALEDPALKALKEQAEKSNKEFFEALRKRMNEVDPGLEALVRGKGKPEGSREGRQWNRDGKNAGDREKRGPARLDEGERQRLMTAREAAKADPAVQAAKKKLKEAATPEERRAAFKEFSKTLREAILKADPTMESLLDKMPPHHAHPEGKEGKGDKAAENKSGA